MPDRQRGRRQPIVDVVMLSKASDDNLRLMTQRAVQTCANGADKLPINLLVIEQESNISYPGVNTTVHMPGEFNFNRFLNRGASWGSAEWILAASNDLIFHDGWLHALLAADHPVVSPKCPQNPRQAGISENTSGTRTSVHLSGWCFMIRRETWQQIGGFDETVSFWCSDDVVIEQLKAIGIEPMLVPSSRVEHLQSVTLMREPDPYDLTWKQIDIFGQKYGPHWMSRDPKYLMWKRFNSLRDSRPMPPKHNAP
jgi:GT2 family glycosyltransferase